MGVEPTASSLGKRISIVNRGVRRSGRSFLVRKVFCFQRWVFRSHLIEVIKVTDRFDSFSGRAKDFGCSMNETPELFGQDARTARLRRCDGVLDHRATKAAQLIWLGGFTA